MAETIPDLWADDIRVDVLTPLAILRTQQGLLKKRTQGVLDAKVTSVEENGLVQHQFDVVATAIQRYQERVLIATHASGRVYPVTVKAETLEHLEQLEEDDILTDECIVFTEEDFIQIIRQVFQSGEVRSAMQSLIAQSNEIHTNRSAPAVHPEQ
ncbi:MAG: hypothetical protein P4L84_13580 [Isosphaeraceae bacterium]|nr:hypothetical protein [Isosphaeraceae bacterium]